MRWESTALKDTDMLIELIKSVPWYGWVIVVLAVGNVFVYWFLNGATENDYEE